MVGMHDKLLATIQALYKGAYQIEELIYIPLRFLRRGTMGDLLCLNTLEKKLEVYYIVNGDSLEFKSYVKWTKKYPKEIIQSPDERVLSAIKECFDKVRRECDKFEKELGPTLSNL